MSKPFHVHLDLDALNNNTDPTAPAPALSFEETRTQPFLDGTAEDYFVAIARFSIYRQAAPSQSSFRQSRLVKVMSIRPSISSPSYTMVPPGLEL